MPQPIKSLSIKINPHSLIERPDIACRIAVITSLWTDVEDELAFQFGAATLMQPAVAAAILGRVANVTTRLDMIETAFELAFPTDVVSRFQDELKPQIRKRSSERARLVHCHWVLHPDYPEHLIHVRGLTDPQMQMTAYTLKDFIEIEVRLLELSVALKEFAKSFAPYLQKREPAKSFWQLSSPDPPDDEAKPRL